MKNSLKTTARWSTLVLAMGILSIPAFQAQAAINWPGGTGDKNKDTDFQEGYDNGQQDCRDTPHPCGVKLYPMIKKQGYGETEPNDHILNADGLLLGQFYHANTLGNFDEDWYYVVTDKPSQKLTVYFLADPENFTNTAGWIIEVRDLNGNIIAAFDSTREEGDAGILPINEQEGGGASPVDSAKVTEVTLGSIGTYYISVKSKEEAGQLRGYNIAANLEDTGQVTANPGENRFDTETEPNNDKDHADPLRSNVAMAGVFNRTLVKRVEVTTPAKTTYEYFYKGCTDAKLVTPGSPWEGFNGNNCSCDISKNPPADPLVPPHPAPTDVTPPGGNAVTAVDDPDDACWAKATTTPAETKYVGIFKYDTDVFVYHSEGNEQLRLQICTRTECQFEKVHLRINKDNTSIVIMEGPVVPGQVIDLGAALQGDYYFEFSAEEEGVVSDTGDSTVSELLGSYDVLLMGTKFSPHGN
ncbi:hypothetical protein [Thiolapillus sp.]